MKIGVPKEIKPQEYRIGLVPSGVRQLSVAGHKLFVETGAGLGSNISDDDFREAGATIIDDVDELWQMSEMIIKVKEPLPAEYPRIQKNQIIYTYFHLAAVPELLPVLLEQHVTAIAYETIQLANGSLPLLRPMSEVAGRMATQVGALCLEKRSGGKGILLGGVPGVARAQVTIIGGGVVGTQAARIAIGMGARVTLLDLNIVRLNQLEEIFGNAIDTMYSHAHNIAACVAKSDLVIGAVLIPGARAPKLVTREMIASMSPGSVVVDVAVDQGGCIETARPTTHENPTFLVDGVIHYCVANMPGAVPRTSTYALTNVTLSYALAIANFGVTNVLIKRYPELAPGINTCKGHVTYAVVAKAMDADFMPLEQLLD